VRSNAGSGSGARPFPPRRRLPGATPRREIIGRGIVGRALEPLGELPDSLEELERILPTPPRRPLDGVEQEPRRAEQQQTGATETARDEVRDLPRLDLLAPGAEPAEPDHDPSGREQQDGDDGDRTTRWHVHEHQCAVRDRRPQLGVRIVRWCPTTLSDMLPLDVLKLDHVAVATWDVRNQVVLLTDVLGARFVDGGDQQPAGFRWLQFTVGGGKVEVLEPLHRDGFLYRFLTRRGEGLHHVTFYVPDLEAAIPELTAAGYEPVDADLTHEGWKEAFLHPRDTSGVMIQLAQVPTIEDPREPPRSLESFLDDRPGLRPDA